MDTLSKNGTDQKQNGELREIREYLRANANEHAGIMSQLAAYDTALQVQAARDEEKEKADRNLKRQVFALFLVFLTQTAGLVGWGVSRYDKLHDGMEENARHFTEFQAIGIEWGDSIDERAAGFKEDIRQIRKQMNEHQRNGKRHSN